ncbi:nucleoredoxin-like protein 1 [Corapipo altera]|uniref:nucleoredoxin-like protein 1 n=1 Tax=Corapipo altera TaxID=415028 RepID=UPI000FD68771|nr:nucleoredoxin-like protein 1 [Corapipo altera]
MSALFAGKVLKANREEDELDTERELRGALDNKVLLLYFGSGQCPRCQDFAPLLKDFFQRLTDEFYVERSRQLVLVYVSRDETEEQQSAFLRSMPRRWLALPFGDTFGRYGRGTGVLHPRVAWGAEGLVWGPRVLSGG